MLLNAVLCVWNEEDIIESTVLHAFAQGCAQVYLVDNGSTDATVARATACGARLATSFHTDVFDEMQKIMRINATIEALNRQSGQDSAWWLIIDADEFPDIDGPGRIIDFLRDAPPDIRAVHGVLHDHVPTHPPHHIRLRHPADTMPLARKTATGKVPLLRYDKGKPHIFSEGGALSFTVEGDDIPVLRDRLTIHHFPYRGFESTEQRLRALLRKREDGSSRIDWIDAYVMKRLKTPSGYHARYHNLKDTYSRDAHAALRQGLAYDFKNLVRWYGAASPPVGEHDDPAEAGLANGLFFFFLGEFETALFRFNELFEHNPDPALSLWIYLKVMECMLRTGEPVPAGMLDPVMRSRDAEALAYLDAVILPLMRT